MYCSASLLVAATLAGLGLMVQAAPAHKDCEYSGIVGGIRYTGKCSKSGNNWNHGAGSCIIPGFDGSYGCDFPYRNADYSPCFDAAQSQYACKREGDPCYVFDWAEDRSQQVFHCSVA